MRSISAFFPIHPICFVSKEILEMKGVPVAEQCGRESTAMRTIMEVTRLFIDWQIVDTESR